MCVNGDYARSHLCVRVSAYVFVCLYMYAYTRVCAGEFVYLSNCTQQLCRPTQVNIHSHIHTRVI